MAIVLFQVPIQGVNSLQRNRWIFHFDNRNIENWKYVKPKALFDTLISRATSALSVRWGFCTFFLDINLQVNHSSQNITRFGSLVITQKNNCTYTFSCTFYQSLLGRITLSRSEPPDDWSCGLLLGAAWRDHSQRSFQSRLHWMVWKAW